MNQDLTALTLPARDRTGGRHAADATHPATGVAGKLFQAAGLAPPPNLQEIPTRDATPAA